MNIKSSKLRETKSYTIIINGVEHRGFTKVSTWNGLTKFENDKGSVIAHVDNDFITGVFNEIFKSTDDSELSIITLSPCFIPTTDK